MELSAELQLMKDKLAAELGVEMAEEIHGQQEDVGLTYYYKNCALKVLLHKTKCAQDVELANNNLRNEIELNEIAKENHLSNLNCFNIAKELLLEQEKLAALKKPDSDSSDSSDSTDKIPEETYGEKEKQAKGNVIISNPRKRKSSQSQYRHAQESVSDEETASLINDNSENMQADDDNEDDDNNEDDNDDNDDDVNDDDDNDDDDNDDDDNDDDDNDDNDDDEDEDEDDSDNDESDADGSADDMDEDEEMPKDPEDDEHIDDDNVEDDDDDVRSDSDFPSSEEEASAKIVALQMDVINYELDATNIDWEYEIQAPENFDLQLEYMMQAEIQQEDICEPAEKNNNLEAAAATNADTASDLVGVSEHITEIMANRAQITIKRVEEPTQSYIDEYQVVQTSHTLPDFEEFRYLTAAEIEARLHNVSVTALPNHKDPENNVEHASAQWFYAQYLSYIENPSIETCLMASVAATAAAAAYRNAVNLSNDIPLYQRVQRVSAEASLYVLASAYYFARQNCFSNLQSYKDIFQLYGLAEAKDHQELLKNYGFEQ